MNCKSAHTRLNYSELRSATLFFSSFLHFWKLKTQPCIILYMTHIYTILHSYTPMPVAARPKAWVCRRSFAGIVGSNPAETIDVCLSWVSCLGRQRSLSRADHPSRGVVPSGVCSVTLSANPRTGRPWVRIRSKRQRKNNYTAWWWLDKRPKHVALGFILRYKLHLTDIYIYIYIYIGLTWALKENMTNKLMIFERKIMRKIFGPTRTDDGYWRIKTNQEINDIWKGKNIIGFIKKKNKD